MQPDQEPALETALRASAHLMLKHVKVAMALFDAHTLCLLAANPSYDALLPVHWQHGQALGHALPELVSPSVRHQCIELFHQVVQTGSSCSLETSALPADIEESMCWNGTLDPIVEDGRVQSVLLTVTKVSPEHHIPAQVRQDQQWQQGDTAAWAPPLAVALASMARGRLHADLGEERQRLDLLLDQLPEGIILVEARTSKVRYANPVAAELLGCALSHLIGAPLNQSAPISTARQTRAHLPEALRWNFALIDALWGKFVSNREMHILRSDGSEIIVLCSTAPIRASNGLVTEAVIVLQDMTALKQLERQKNEFFAVASHELRTPLTTILGWVELLQMTAQQDADSRQQKAISNIVQEGDRLRLLIQDLLDVSRLEDGYLQINRGRHELLAPLRALVSKQAQTTSIHRVHFTLKDLDPTEHLMGDVDLLRIEQIVTNLLNNAIKYSPAGGEIEVGLHPRHDAEGTPQEVLLWVKDQGIGIAAPDRARIFERFYRADTYERTSISGFGIGLYLTRKLVQAHGGRIWVESSKGRGSTFFVALPLATITLGEPSD